MGLGSSQPRKKIYYLTPKATRLVDGKKVVDPHFSVKMTDENGVTNVLPDEKKVSGNLHSISHGEYEFPKDSGKKIKTVSVYLVDGGAMFKISGSVNTNMIRGLMNTVAGTRTFDKMEISLYEKDGFPNLFVRNNNEKGQWRFDYKTELGPLITTAPDPQDETKTVKIYHQVNALLWSVWLETEPVVAAYAKKMGYSEEAPATASEERPKEEVDSLQQELDDMAEPAIQQQSHYQADYPAPVMGADDDLPF